jgi:hypothetical protein
LPDPSLVSCDGKFFGKIQGFTGEKKYRGFTGGNGRELQGKPLRSREKSRRRKNRKKTGKEQGQMQCATQWKPVDIGARADASPCHIDSPKNIARRRKASGAHIRD